MASYNEFKSNLQRDALIVSATDSLTSTFAGFTTFSMIAYMAYLRQVPVAEAVKAGPGLAFEVFPQAIATLPGAQVWSFLFFLMLVTLGLGSELVLYGTVTTAAIDQFPKLKKYKTAVVGCGCLICFLIGLPLCTKGGVGSVHDLRRLLQWICGDACGPVRDSVRLLGVWSGPILERYETHAGQTAPHLLAYHLGLYHAGVLFIAYEPAKESEKVLSASAQLVGWFLTSMPMLAILLFAVIRIVDIRRTGQPWDTLVIPTVHWCPAADLAKRSRARHDVRLYVLEHPKRLEHIPETESSKFKTGSGGGKSEGGAEPGL